MLDRRRFGLAAGAGLLTPRLSRAAETALAGDLGMTLSEEQRAAGRSFLKANPSVDVHSHAGRFFMAGPAGRTPLALAQGPAEPLASIARMRAGGVSGVLFAAVADFPLLEASPQGLRSAREYRPGEAFADYRRQLRLMQALVAGGQVVRGLDSGDIRRAHRDGTVACVFSIEGGDFIEDRLERIADGYARGVRSITIVHYHTNQIGDPQTAAPVHGGLTPLGRDVVRTMNWTGVLIDLAHASFDTSRQAVEASAKPMIISHSNLRTPGLDHPRLISLEHARLVTDAGGVVGALPAGAGETRFVDYIDTLLRTVDLLGADHVAIGTDMDFTFKSVLADYGDWSLVPAALLARGMAPPEVAKLVGGNVMRLLDTVRV